MSDLPIYFDYAATTPADPAVAQAMSACLTLDGDFGNPASRSHVYGWQAEELVETARAQVATLLDCDVREIVWTSGATESDNLALQGVAQARASAGRHIITSPIEHKAVVDTAQWLEGQGFEVTWLDPGPTGRVEARQVAAALRPDTILVSLMAVNNELGTMNDLAAIGEVVAASNAYFHVDAAQALGKVPLHPHASGVDLMSFSAHKLYGPKGIGALFVANDPALSLDPIIHGGGHERGWRSGTLATHQIVGMGKACELAHQHMAEEAERLEALRTRLLDGISNLPGVHLNGDPDHRLPGIVNLGVEGVDGEALILSLAPDLACSTGSACNSATVEPSYVLRGIGLPDVLADASIRLSMGRFTTEGDVDFAVTRLNECIQRLRALETR